MRVIQLLDEAMVKSSRSLAFYRCAAFYITDELWRAVRMDDLYPFRVNVVSPLRNMEKDSCVGYFNGLPVRIVTSMPHVVNETGEATPIDTTDKVEYVWKGELMEL